MGKFYWKRYRYTSHQKDSYQDITNWKLIRYHRSIGDIEGSTIVIRDFSKPFGLDTIFAPGLPNIKNLIQLSNSPTDLETFFIKTMEGIDRCEKCKGVGKFDWANKATNSYIYDYVRDPAYILIYEPNYKKPSISSAIYQAPYLALARTKVDESKGEVFCEVCLGTGLDLDGRHKIFSGFNNIRYNLKVIKWE